jgi:aromatic ring-opening dioxygenase catalytic subunit (LigB family)
MGQIALGIGTSHSPGQTGQIDFAPRKQVENCYEAWYKLRDAVESIKPDLIVEITNGHYSNFQMHNMPAMCIGIGATHWGPPPGDAEMIRITPGEIPGQADFGLNLVQAAYQAGFDPAWSGDLNLDHGVMVPYHTLNVAHDIPLVPILINAMIDPIPTPSRMYHFGEFLRGFIASRPKNERVLIIGAGGLAHDVGTERSGWIDEDFDHQFIENLEHDRVEAVWDYDSVKFARSGNGAQETLAWIATMGAMGGQKFKTLSYEPVVEWITGTGIGMWEQ